MSISSLKIELNQFIVIAAGQQQRVLTPFILNKLFMRQIKYSVKIC